MEASHAEQGLTRSRSDEEEGEELCPLSPPPTLSITEEIMQFINQSRVREGLAELPTDTVCVIVNFLGGRRYSLKIRFSQTWSMSLHVVDVSLFQNTCFKIIV